MATIRKRGLRYQAMIRRNEHAPISRTFANRADAQLWARGIEREMDLGTFRTNDGVPADISLKELLARYVSEVTPRKKGHVQEAYRISRLMLSDLAARNLKDLSPAHLARFRDERLKSGTEAARYDLVLIQGVINTAMREWGLDLQQNPVTRVTKPKPVRARERRLTDSELTSIVERAHGRCGGVLLPTILLAIETGMRRSELLSMTWANVALSAGAVTLPDSKNGKPRSVPLTNEAIQILGDLPREADAVLPISANALALGWKRLMRTCAIADLRFHDLRHEAISRFFEMGLNVPEVALISGHRTPSQLFRYTNLKADLVGEKLRRVPVAMPQAA
ncbi:probable site-specific integrase/recombinase [alpha proteobacterium BAL199]|nr:probable site-specific integrase/recombinase [alpha proteobacterium BAL199]